MSHQSEPSPGILVPRRVFLAIVVIVTAAAILLLLDGRPRTGLRPASPFVLSLTEQSIVDGAVGITTTRSIYNWQSSPNLSHVQVSYTFDTDEEFNLSQEVLVPVKNAFGAIRHKHGAVRIGTMFLPAYGKTCAAARGTFDTKDSEGAIGITVTRDRDTITIIIEIYEVDR